MVISSKFDTGMIVWFFARKSNDAAKFYEGRVVIPERWDRYNGWSYNVERVDAEKSTIFSVFEKDMYSSREEASEAIFIPSEVNLGLNTSEEENTES